MQSLAILPTVRQLSQSFTRRTIFTNYQFTDYQILTDYQSGFRKGFSTCFSLLRTTNEWLVNMDKGLINGVVFLDLKKAFDTVDHDILIKKLEFYGIKNNTLCWFISYLSHRKQVCKVGIPCSFYFT